MPALSALRHLLACTFNEWLRHRASSKGAALAFYTLFSLAPVLILVLAIAGLFYGQEAARGELLQQLRGLLGQSGAAAVQLILAGARPDHDGGLATALAGATLLLGASSVFAELQASLDEVWQVTPATELSLWRVLGARLRSFGMVLVLAFLLLVSLVVSASLALFERYWGMHWRDTALLLRAFSGLFGFLVIATLFAFIFKLLPRARLAWPDVAVGALGTALLFSLGKYLIGAYIGNSDVTSGFGAASSVIALLLWVYYSAQIFFLGAEFARQYALQLGSLRPRPDGRP